MIHMAASSSGCSVGRSFQRCAGRMARSYRKLAHWWWRGLLELDDDGQVVHLLDRVEEVPDVAVGDDRVLAQLDGVDDVVGGERLAVGPGDALTELDGVLVIRGPLAALGEPGDVLVGHAGRS